MRYLDARYHFWRLTCRHHATLRAPVSHAWPSRWAYWTSRRSLIGRWMHMRNVGLSHVSPTGTATAQESCEDVAVATQARDYRHPSPAITTPPTRSLRSCLQHGTAAQADQDLLQPASALLGELLCSGLAAISVVRQGRFEIFLVDFAKMALLTRLHSRHGTMSGLDLQDLAKGTMPVSRPVYFHARSLHVDLLGVFRGWHGICLLLCLGCCMIMVCACSSAVIYYHRSSRSCQNKQSGPTSQARAGREIMLCRQDYSPQELPATTLHRPSFQPTPYTSSSTRSHPPSTPPPPPPSPPKPQDKPHTASSHPRPPEPPQPPSSTPQSHP